MQYFYRFVSLFLVALCIAMTGETSFAQQKKIQLQEGREFYFGIPHCKRATEGEPTWGGAAAVQLWIGSNTKTTVTIEAKELGSIKSYNIDSGKVKIIAVDEGLMNTESEIITSKGIHITSKDPITVTGYVSYKWSGEAFDVIPVENLGKKYYTLNLYQDSTNQYKPGQILIVATKDNTSVSFIPAAETVKGIKKNGIGKVVLQKGQAYLIESKYFAEYNQDKFTDLTGTYIESTYPIAVISGHTKGAFPRFSTTMLSRPADFMRNMLCDMMWPVEFLGNEYVSVPIKYNDRPSNGTDIDADGDLIRFVATKDNTTIYKMRNDGTGLLKISPVLRRGQVFEIINQMDPVLFHADNPVLVGEYGKSWRLNVVTPIIAPSSGTGSKKGEQTLNPNRNGQGMMFGLIPPAQWSSSAVFHCPDLMNNFVNVTFLTKDGDSLFFDGRQFRTAFGAAMQKLAGTQYSYVSYEISAGDHAIIGKSDAVFGAYVYGNYDHSKDGFAYGYPIGVNYALSSPPDSLIITDQQQCGNVTGTVRVYHKTADDYVGLHSITMDSKTAVNYTFRTNPEEIESGADRADYYLTIIDPTQDAYGVVNIVDKTGTVHTRTYSYIAQKIVASPTSLDFGTVVVGDKQQCKTLTLKNTSTTNDTVKSIKFKAGFQEFTMTLPSFPLILAPGETKDINVCAQMLKAGQKLDSIQAELSCYSPMIAEVKVAAGVPKMLVYDKDFGHLPLNIESPAWNTEITNIGDQDVIITKADWDDHTHFRTEGLEQLDKGTPIVIPGHGKYPFAVFYKPDAVPVNNVRDIAHVHFTANTTLDKVDATWVGDGIDAGPYVTPKDWLKRRISKTYDGEIQVGNVSPTNSPLRFIDLVIDPSQPDASAFSLDAVAINGYKGQGQDILPSTPLPVGVTFHPTEEREYKVIVKFTGRDPSATLKPAEAFLTGIGIQPHVDSLGYDFGKLKVGDSKTGFAVLKAVIMNTGGDDLAIAKSSLKIIDFEDVANTGDAASFQADFSNVPDIIPNGTEIQIPVTFTATSAKSFKARLYYESDAPEKRYPVLLGEGYTNGTPGAKPTGHTFNTMYVTLTDKGMAYIENTGDLDLKVTNTEIDPSSADANYFTIDPTFVTSFSLPVGAKVPVPVSFTPAVEGHHYIANVKFTFDKDQVPAKFAQIDGYGKRLPVTVSIPRDYHALPGSTVEAEFQIRNDDVTRPLTDGNVKEFKASIQYRPEVMRINTDLNSFNLKGTLMENGWKVTYAQAIPGDDPSMEKLDIHFVPNDPNTILTLPGNGKSTLFKFQITAYLAKTTETELPCNMDPLVVYMDVSKEPGKFVVDPFCASDGRAVVKLGNYLLSPVMPNPVSSSTDIHYSLAMSAPTRLVVFNSKGEEVAVLVNSTQTPGDYTVKFDASSLASGVYFYKLTSGPFNDTQTMNVTK